MQPRYLFNGDDKAVIFVELLETGDDLFIVLGNVTVDVLAGRRVERKFESESLPSSKP